MIYHVHSIFDTIQGEGARAGARSVFIRLAGCNLWSGKPEQRAFGKGACARWCDTDFVHGDPLTPEGILNKIDRLWPGRSLDRWCVITGGEPMLQVDDDLIDALHGNFWHVAIESNGTLNPPGKIDHAVLDAVDWLTISPKIGTRLIRRRASEIKVVLPGAVGNEGFGWKDDELEAIRELCSANYYFVQPQDPIVPHLVESTYLKAGFDQKTEAMGKEYAANVERCVSFVRDHPMWRMSVQIHKALGLP